MVVVVLVDTLLLAPGVVASDGPTLECGTGEGDEPTCSITSALEVDDNGTAKAPP